MALDMLARRENLEQIAEVLLTQGQIVEAIRCWSAATTKQQQLTIDRLNCLKILQAAWRTDNRQIKYTIYSHLAVVRKVPYFDGNCGFFYYLREVLCKKKCQIKNFRSK